MNTDATTDSTGGETLLLFFASLREKMGRDRMTLHPADGETVRSLAAKAAHVAGIDTEELLDGRLMFAVNRERVDADHPVGAGDEVALLPPLSGGL